MASCKPGHPHCLSERAVPLLCLPTKCAAVSDRSGASRPSTSPGRSSVWKPELTGAVSNCSGSVSTYNVHSGSCTVGSPVLWLLFFSLVGNAEIGDFPGPQRGLYVVCLSTCSANSGYYSSLNFDWVLGLHVIAGSSWAPVLGGEGIMLWEDQPFVAGMLE